MRAPIFALAVLLPAAAMAQTAMPQFPPRQLTADRATEIVGAQLGALVIENAKLRAQAEALQAEVNDLRVKVDALRKQQPGSPEAKPTQD